MADGDDAGNGSEDKDKGSPKPAPTNLDDVHEQIQNERGDEFSTQAPADDEVEPDEDDTAKAEGDSGDVDEDDDTEAGGAADGAGGDTTDADTAQSGADKVDADDTAKDDTEEPTPPEIDSDVTKPGKYKQEFVDDEGNKYFVNDVRQLPDDFEPRSQKEYGVALQDLSDKRRAAQTDQSEYQTKKAEGDRVKAVKSLRQSWDADIERLTTEKELPADPKQREKVVNGVYQLMDSEMKKGKVIENWATAHELYQAREAKKAAAAAEKAKDEAVKKNGSKVMGGGSAGTPPASGGGRGKVMEGPPPGVGLDAVHERAIANL